jgi:protein-disulfide isomerase
VPDRALSQRPRLPSDGSDITIRLRRSQLLAIVAAVALVVGIAIGLVIGRATSDDPQTVLYGLPGAQAGNESPAAAPAKPVDVDTSGSPAQGPADAKVTMVEFVDFECPFCGRYAHDTLPRIRREYGDRIRYVSRQFPLEIHPDAPAAARAAVCAQEQGRYWQLHDLLFAHQDALGRRDLVRYAQQAGIDAAPFASCLRSDAAEALVQHDLADGRRYGVTGTPAFFVDGRLISGAQPYEQFKAALDAALKG